MFSSVEVNCLQKAEQGNSSVRYRSVRLWSWSWTKWNRRPNPAALFYFGRLIGKLRLTSWPPAGRKGFAVQLKFLCVCHANEAENVLA